MDSGHSLQGLTLAALAREAGATLVGDGATLVRRVGTLDGAGADAITFLANRKYRGRLASTRAAAVILSPADASATPLPKLVSSNPYATFARVAALLHPDPSQNEGVHPTAVVDASARIGDGVAIGAHAVVGARAQIGEGVRVGPGCSVGDDVAIGDRSHLYPNVVVYPRCVIGARTVLHSGVVIGADGFGFASEGGRWLRVPQLGRVLIGNDCDIGANTTIDRGAIDDTVVEDGVKLDNQIQIGHNCTIGADTAIAGCVGIAGSVHIGRNCRIGGAAMISGHLSIADGTTVSGGSLILASIDAPDVYTSVFPALPHRRWRKVAAQLRHLDELVERLRALEQRAGASAHE